MKVVVLMSGGVDSTVCAWLARSQGHEVVPVSVWYGQRHQKEIQHAIKLCEVGGLSRPHVVTLSNWAPSSALTDFGVDVPHCHHEDPAQTATMVPNRNMVLLSLACGLAASWGAREVWLGAHRGDNAIYPDCRAEFIMSMNRSLAIAGLIVQVLSPLSGMDKAGVVCLARELGVPLQMCWSCYEGGESPCGKCGACMERRGAGA